MTAPRWLAEFNRTGTNRLFLQFAGQAPGFGIVTHRGRRSGRLYRTPVNVFRTRGGYAIALTYGPQSDWVKNVRAAGGCDLATGGRTMHLVEPQLVHDERRRAVPPPVRLILRAIGASDFLTLHG